MRFTFIKLLAVVFFIASSGFVLNKYLLDQSLGDSFLFEAFYKIACLVIVIFLFSKFSNINLNPKGSFDWKFLIGSFLILIGLIIFNLVIFLPVNRDSFITYHQNYPQVNFLLILTLTVFPILEELFFRKVSIELLLRKYSSIKTILLSAMLFSVAHVFTSSGILSVFLGGIFFGYVYIKTKSIYLVILLHIIINLVNFPLSKGLVYLIENSELIQKYPTQCYLLSISIAVFLIALGIVKTKPQRMTKI